MKNIARKLSALLLVFVVSMAALCPAFAASASLRACPASSLREGGAFGTVPSYVCAYTKALYRLLCAESTAPEILKKGETVPHAQAL